MSGQMKAKSLSLSRKTQTPPKKEESLTPVIKEEDEAHLSNLEAILNSPIARPARLCSTPIQKNVDLMEESPDQDYRCSPMSLFPCTQDSNEIAWDWQSGIVNKGNGSPGSRLDNKSSINNPGNLNNTPKRRQQLFPKKRSAKSYSPLLNVPNKRKLANLDVAESIGKFAAELTALAEKIKTEQNEENNERKKNGDGIAGDSVPGTSKELGIFSIKTQASFDIHEITTLKIDCVAEDKVTDTEKLDSSLDDFFDDSVDACMIQCSQEIEDKFKIDSGGTGGKLLVPDLSNERKTAGCRASTSSANPNIAPKSCSVNIESRYDCKIKKESSIPDLKSGEKSRTEEHSDNIPASQIPDDSFDDCLALCVDEADEMMSKFMEDKKAEAAAKKANISPITNPTDSGLNFKRKQQCMGSESGPGTIQSRKYFKTKSLSDSYCGNSAQEKIGGNKLSSNSNLGRSYPPPTTAKTSPNFNMNFDKLKANGNQSKVSSTPNLNNFIPAAGGGSNWNKNSSKPGASSSSSSGNTVSYSYLKNGNSNIGGSKTGPGNFDPYSNFGRQSEKPLKDLRTTMPSSSQYSAEEIERKRLEAKMKLQANKMKKQQIISSGKSIAGISMQNNKRSLVKR